MPTPIITGTSRQTRAWKIRSSELGTALGPIIRGQVLAAPNSSKGFAVATSGPGYGVAANDAALGEVVQVVTDGEVDTICGATGIDLSVQPALVATTAGRVAPAAALNAATRMTATGSGTLSNLYAQHDYVRTQVGNLSLAAT
jgi:hypothetical protein